MRHLFLFRYKVLYTKQTDEEILGMSKRKKKKENFYIFRGRSPHPRTPACKGNSGVIAFPSCHKHLETDTLHTFFDEKGLKTSAVGRPPPSHFSILRVSYWQKPRMTSSMGTSPLRTAKFWLRAIEVRTMQCH